MKAAWAILCCLHIDPRPEFPPSSRANNLPLLRPAASHYLARCSQKPSRTSLNQLDQESDGRRSPLRDKRLDAGQRRPGAD